MSSAAPITNDPAHFTAKKRLARDLWVIVIVQAIALCAVVLGFFLYSSNRVPNDPAWDGIHSLCGVLALFGMIVFVVSAFWGNGKLFGNTLLSFPSHLYAWSIWMYFPFFFFGTHLLLALEKATGLPMSPILYPIVGFMLFAIFPFYSIIPQFLIARWLAKEAEEGTAIHPEAMTSGDECH